MAVNISGNEIIFSEFILCPTDKEIGIHIPAFEGNSEWELRIIFSDLEDEDVDSAISRSIENDIWTLDFQNWGKIKTTRAILPWNFANTDNGKKIIMIAAVEKIGTLYRLHLQLYVGGAAND